MKFPHFLRLPLASLFIFSLVGIAADEPDPGQVEISVGKLLEGGHYSRKRLDDKVSQVLLKNYLEALDYNRLFFTQKEVDNFTTRYATTLDDDILLGNPDAAFHIYNVYKKRVEERAAHAKELLKETYDFSSDRTFEFNRQKSPWPKDAAELDQLWRNKVEAELLQETLTKHKLDPPLKVLTRRYDQLLRNLREQTREDVMKVFLSTLAQTYDPHSDYMSRSELENFEINMRLALVGIGAVLQSEEGYAKIAELVPGPAAKDGRLKVGDRITAVAQGEKEFVDTVDMKLDKVVEMIRGKKDTLVRLQVIPATATDPSVRKVVEIKRDEIKLKDAEAKAEIIERAMQDGTTQRLGWITLPSFYADMGKSGVAGAKSTTRDVLALLNRLKAEGITGLVMDLRRNGGGSLEEAVNLTGLFIKRGPVVQSKESSGAMNVNRDKDPAIAYDGPMVVLTNRLSASASEIFAGALQDYNRALVVGDKNTFGKGTVQTMLEIGKVVPFLGGGSKEAGALKLTIQKFYRVAGGSTQLHGVASDIHLPSLFDQAEIGESSLKGPLPYDTVKPQEFDAWERPLFKAELSKRSSARVAVDREFGYVMEDLERMQKRVAENKISLNEKVRRAELEEDKARKEKRAAERAAAHIVEPKVFSITLDNVTKPELQLAKDEKKPERARPQDAEAEDEEEGEAEAAGKKVDAVRNETLNILADLVEIIRNPPATGTITAGK